MSELPWITTDDMREVDRAMIEDYGIKLLQMMENAGRNLARLALTRFLAVRGASGEVAGDTGLEDTTESPVLSVGNGRAARDSVVVLCGSGGNGGGSMVCARRLQGWGFDVRVILARPNAEYEGVPRHQRDILDAVGVPVVAGSEAA